MASINESSEVYFRAAPARSPSSVQYALARCCAFEYIMPDDSDPLRGIASVVFSNSFDNALSQIQSPCSNPVSGTDA